MDKKTLSIVGIVLILAAIPFTVYLNRRRQQTITEAAPATVLSVKPEAVAKEVGDIFTVDIQIDTGENHVFGVDLDLSFNNLVLEAQSISPGDFFDNPQEMSKEIDNDGGTIFLGILPSSFASQQGSGVLATIEFEAKAEGTSPITFGSGTSVAAADEMEGLQNTISGAVTVGGGEEPTPTPTPTPTTPPGEPTPTPTEPASGGPTPTPTSTPTPTPKPTPTPTSGGTGSSYAPTPTPTPTPAPVPNTGTVGPTVFVSLLSLALAGLGVRMRIKGS